MFSRHTKTTAAVKAAEGLRRFLETSPNPNALKKHSARAKRRRAICRQPERLLYNFLFHRDDDALEYLSEFIENSENAGNSRTPDCFLLSLEILVRPIVHALKRFLDVLDGIRDAETQITFTKFSERGAGQRRNSSIFEKSVS